MSLSYTTELDINTPVSLFLGEALYCSSVVNGSDLDQGDLGLKPIV